MTRIKEVALGSQEVPDYKSPPSRLVTSLRIAYNNIREKLAETRKEIKFYQIKTRDLELSRNKWKSESTSKQNEIHSLEKELEFLKKKNIILENHVEESKKKI